MAAGRPRTVISPPPAPRESKAKPKDEAPEWKPRPGQPTWRVRPTAPDPFDGMLATVYGTHEEVMNVASRWQVQGLVPVVETLTQALWSVPGRTVPTVEELARRGLARTDGRRYTLTPEGQAEIYEAMGLGKAGN